MGQGCFEVDKRFVRLMWKTFLDCEDILLIDSNEGNATVNSINYAYLLYELRDNIHEIYEGKLIKSDLLQDNNAPVHAASVSQAVIHECVSQEWEHYCTVWIWLLVIITYFLI